VFSGTLNPTLLFIHSFVLLFITSRQSLIYINKHINITRICFISHHYDYSQSETPSKVIFAVTYFSSLCHKQPVGPRPIGLTNHSSKKGAIKRQISTDFCVSHTAHVVDIGWTSVCPSVCLSVTRWYCVETAHQSLNCLHCLVAP